MKSASKTDVMKKLLSAAMNQLPAHKRREIDQAFAQSRNDLDELREQRLRNKDYSGYLLTYESHKRFHQFVKIVPGLSPGRYWQLLRDVWMMVEVIQPDRRKWLSLLQSRRPGRESLMTHQEHEELAGLPDEIEIWRGYGQKPGLRGLSWTLERKQAERFASYACGGRRAVLASQQQGSTPMIAVAKCHKSDVFAYFTEREESEIVVNPDNVTVLQASPVVPLTQSKSTD